MDHVINGTMVEPGQWHRVFTGHAVQDHIKVGEQMFEYNSARHERPSEMELTLPSYVFIPEQRGMAG